MALGGASTPQNRTYRIWENIELPKREFGKRNLYLYRKLYEVSKNNSVIF